MNFINYHLFVVIFTLFCFFINRNKEQYDETKTKDVYVIIIIPSILYSLRYIYTNYQIKTEPQIVNKYADIKLLTHSYPSSPVETSSFIF